jgi:hypothetical protein
MAGRTPNLDRLATEGMRFTDLCLQKGASFNMDQVKDQIQRATAAHTGS